jgi:hypothetical protein
MKENRLLLLLWLLAITMVAFALYSWGRLNGWTVVTPS